MFRRTFPVVLITVVAAAACGDRNGGDGTVQTDTLIQTIPTEDTLMIERTIIDDTIQIPDAMRRDTVRGDTLRDTVPR
ncbi:hypothetical protein BH23GEM9_BH23GEM9_23770 [soil metagenome]